MITEKQKIKHSIIFPLVFICTIWIIKIYEYTLNISISEYGLLPRKIEGLVGILLSPLIHGDFNHLLSNTISIFILSSAVFYFYRPVSYKIFFLSWIFSNVIVWIFARPSYHIGCSGIIYSLASFLFISGIIRKNFRLLAITLLVTFLYGGMIWGVFPLQKGISWESHLIGMLIGIILAIIYKNEGPKAIIYDWLEEEEGESSDDDESQNNFNSENNEKINYYYKSKDDIK